LGPITAASRENHRYPAEPDAAAAGPPFYAAWDPVPRRHFDATLVTVHTDEGVTGLGAEINHPAVARYTRTD
jgi:L-alanine-DL-glutamate epimerase-like enolase superfamily enzyme